MAAKRGTPLDVSFHQPSSRRKRFRSDYIQPWLELNITNGEIWELEGEDVDVDANKVTI